MLTAACLLPLTSCQRAPETPAARTPEAPKTEAPSSTDPRYLALPTPTKTPAWHPPAVEKTQLESGLTVWHLRQGPLPLVAIHVVLPVGSSSDPEGKEGLTRLAADLLDEGAGRRNALQLSDALGTLATDYFASAGLDYVLLSMDALSENFAPSMEILADIVLRPQLKKEEFERRKKHLAAEAVEDASDPQSRMRVGLHRALFGKGYASRPQEGTVASLERIVLQDVKQRVKQLTAASNAHIVIAGDIPKEAALEAVGRYFKGWNGKSATQETKLDQPLPGTTAYVIDFPGAAQSALAVAHLAGGAHDPKFFDELVMNQKLSGSFTGRINMNLREDKGYTYGAFGYFRRYESAGYFAIQSNVVSEKTSESVNEIKKELADFCTTRPLSSLEYQEAKDGLLLGYPMEFSQIDSLGMKLASLPIYNRPADFWSTWPQQVSDVSLSAAQQAMSPYCNWDNYRIIVAGDLAAVRPGLEKLGLNVVELDRDGGVKQDLAQGH